MKTIYFLLTVLIIVAYTSSNGQTKNDTIIFGLKNGKLYKESLFDDYTHREYYTPKHIKAKLKPTFMIRFESQVRISIRPTVVGSTAYAMRFDTELFLENTFGKNFLQIGEHDFDADGKSEIIIAYGVRGSGLLCFIYKYHEPANAVDADRDENWTQVGKFEFGYHDPKYVSTVEGNKIYFPFGSQGASEGWVFVNGKFAKFQ